MPQADSPLAPAPAVQVARFVVEAVKRQVGTRWNQGPRLSPWPVPADVDPAVALVAERRLCGVSEPAARAIWAWHEGLRPVRLLHTIPLARQVLGWQAEGTRCVSLIADDVAAAHGDPRHPDGLSFVLHDLCHLEKFVEPAHYAGQVGFFWRLEQAMTHPSWPELEKDFDATWQADRDYVLADMNGSAIFLFAALKMKLKMAVRRTQERPAGQEPGGPLSARERAAYEPRREHLLSLLGVPVEVMEAARAVSARRTSPDAAAALLAWFEQTGKELLQREPASVLSTSPVRRTSLGL